MEQELSRIIEECFTRYSHAQRTGEREKVEIFVEEYFLRSISAQNICKECSQEHTNWDNPACKKCTTIIPSPIESKDDPFEWVPEDQESNTPSKPSNYSK